MLTYIVAFLLSMAAAAALTPMVARAGFRWGILDQPGEARKIHTRAIPRIGGVAVGSYSNEESRAAWKELVQLLNKTNAKPLIDEIFPFPQLPAAFAKLAGGPMGKVLLRVAP